MKKSLKNRFLSALKIIVSLLFVFCIALNCSACKKKDDLDKLSKKLTNYAIDMTYYDDKKVQASCKVDFVNNTDNVLKDVKFHLYPKFYTEGATDHVLTSTKLNDAYPNGMSYAEFEVERVTIGNQDTTVMYEGEHDSILNVSLFSSIMPDDRVAIDIKYKFSLPNCEHRFGYGEDTINLNNAYPIACVYDENKYNISPYHANGDPFYSDVANYDVTITAPSKYIIAHTGEKVSEKTESNQKTTKMRAKVVRDFSIVMSEKFEVHEEKIDKINLRYFGYNDIDAKRSLKAGVDAIRTFSKMFGKYPYSTFSIVKSDFIYGGMEYPNLVMISDDIDNIDDYMNVIVHETAHQWWYGVVGNDEFRYPWLDEALTEYSTILFYDENEGYSLTHEQMVKINKDNYSLFITVYEEVLGSVDTSMRAVNEYATEPEYTYCTYVKGVLMYDSLYHLIGRNKFVSALGSYYNSCKFTNVTPDKLISSFESACKRELDGFFSSWIKGKVVIK